jgi:hypothetical protein
MESARFAAHDNAPVPRIFTAHMVWISRVHQLSLPKARSAIASPTPLNSPHDFPRVLEALYLPINLTKRKHESTATLPRLEAQVSIGRLD